MVDWTRRQLLALTVALAVVAMLVPVLLSLELARRQARAELGRRASLYAADVTRRSEEIGDQMREAFGRMERIAPADRCGPAGRAVLQGIDASYSHLQFVGVVSGDSLVCSSYGTDVPPLSLGPVDYVANNGSQVRRDVVFPFAPGVHFVAFQQGTSVAVIHKALPVDTTIADKQVSLAVISVARRLVLTQHGPFERAWTRGIDRLAPGEVRLDMVDGRMLARQRSLRYPGVMVVAALGAGTLDGVIGRFAAVLVPIGLVMGVVLAWVLMRLARAQTRPAAAIRSGLRHDEFFLVYQPIVRLSDRRWVGVEALLRWRRAGGQLVMPNQFIPTAEETDLIRALTRRAVRLVEPLLAEFGTREGFFVSINLSPRDLHAEATLDLLHGLIERTGARPAQVHVEITERGLVDTAIAREMVHRLRQAGFGVSIDDFGTGYSSLSELVSFELDTLKIDKAFVDTVGSGAVTSHIAFHIVEVARKLSLAIVAEGIEHPRQAEMLSSWGVDYGQGWLFSQPLPLDDLRNAWPGGSLTAPAEPASLAG